MELYALVDPSPEELELANAYFSPRCPAGVLYKRTDHILEYEGLDYEVIEHFAKPKTPQWPRVRVRTLQRYADEYKTWPWPPIYHAIRLLQATFPNAAVHYGGDGGMYWHPEVTEERIETMWAAWYRDQEKETHHG